MGDDDEVKTMRLWPLQPRHVESSGLRARRVGIVHGQAYCWWVYGPHRGAKWKVERVKVRSVNDLREDGERVLVATPNTRTAACEAILDDAKLLDLLGPPQPTGPVSAIDYYGGAD